MNVLPDGVSVFIDDWLLITGILLFFTAITVPLFSRLKTVPSTGSGQRHRSVISPTSLFLPLFLIISLLLRLAYISKALFPSYFDSAQHYMLINNIMSNGAPQIFEIWRTDYYHLGFHLLAAFFASIFKVEITTVMLVLGQIILAWIPLPLFFIIKQLTRSNWAGMFAVSLSAFGWYMPAHGVDWGKYPALMSLGLILFVLSLVILFAQEKDRLQPGKSNLFLALIGVSVLFTVFVHSRSLIVLGFVAIAWVGSELWMKFPKFPRHAIFALLLIVLIFVVTTIQGSDILSLLFDPYLDGGMLITSLVAILSILAYRSYPQPTFINLLAIDLLLISLFIPVNGLIPKQPHLTLMDRPYVEMILFMPLSLLGGLGLAGLENKVGRKYGKYLALIFIGGIMYHAFANHNFYPSDCCVMVGNDDAAAMVWMEDQLPVEVRIGVASTELKVIARDVVEGWVGADAGVWITPLIARTTVVLPNELAFDKKAGLDSICRKRISHLFVGELGQPFDRTKLIARSEWYRPLLSMPRTGVYEVIGCKDG
ncbi:MAG: DUF6541 family protein [Anaerolineales bacterium]|nr:DUF6541 family protein [Anaerolineales bacterium]